MCSHRDAGDENYMYDFGKTQFNHLPQSKFKHIRIIKLLMIMLIKID